MNKPHVPKLALLVCAAACSVVTGTLLGLARPDAPSNVSQRTLSFAERVAYQRAIEDVYWRHRIWPKERPDPKPSLDAVMSRVQLEKKVADYMHDSQVLRDYWQRPITPEQLQAEMERMAQHTRQPEVLREIFEALGNDPFVIAECLARPVLAERLITKRYADDQEPLESSRAGAEKQTSKVMVAASGNYMLPTISDGPNGCIDDSWTPTSLTSPPDGRHQHTAVWTGSEMIVWGGLSGAEPLNTGGRYNPSTDSWTGTTTTGAPDIRAGHTAVWSGNQMIVWGGFTGAGPLNTGGRYNPTTDSWVATSTINAPDARSGHTAVWNPAGSEMIVWGGLGACHLGCVVWNTGGRYNPSTDTWTATSVANAPSARQSHTAVWIGSQMIIWGGVFNDDSGGHVLKTGGRYNPRTDRWTSPTSTINAPSARRLHTAVWTGKEMIVWGGLRGTNGFVNTGGRYNPSTDTWTATMSGCDAPDARYHHTAVWTGSEMIVWGGINNFGWLNSGGRYNPDTDTWPITSTSNAPSARELHTAVWTGREMIVWGGSTEDDEFNTGGRYCAVAPSPTPTPTVSPTPTPTPMGACNDDTWSPTNTTGAPDGRYRHTAVWTGIEMIVWGGGGDGDVLNTGARYSPSTDSWTATSTTNAPSPRFFHTAVWTGIEMIVWGGYDEELVPFNTGGRYNPSSDSWTATSTTGAPAIRGGHTAVWTGNEMIVWGGFHSGTPGLNTGGRYDPGTDLWTPTTVSNASLARYDHTAIWSGSEMIVWGGLHGANPLNTGGRYNPSSDSWTNTNSSNVPAPRTYHTAIWTGSEMIVWGGSNNGTLFNTGGKYNPSSDSWTATSTTGAPAIRGGHTAVWTGNEMIVWGGSNNNTNLTDLGKYNPSSDSWTATSLTNAFPGRSLHTAILTSSEMIVWGGIACGNPLNTGGRYCARAGSPRPTPTATVTATSTPTPTPILTATPKPTPSSRPSPSVRPRLTPAPRP